MINLIRYFLTDASQLRFFRKKWVKSKILRVAFSQYNLISTMSNEESEVEGKRYLIYLNINIIIAPIDINLLFGVGGRGDCITRIYFHWSQHAIYTIFILLSTLTTETGHENNTKTLRVLPCPWFWNCWIHLRYVF